MGAVFGALGALLQAALILGLLAVGTRLLLRTQQSLGAKAFVLVVSAMLAYGVVASAFGGGR